MEPRATPGDRLIIARILLSCLTGILLVPLVFGASSGIPAHIVFGYVGSILIFQPVAAGIGIALGIPPGTVLLIMFSVGIAVILTFFGICDLFAGRSVWLRDHLDNVNALAGRSALFKKYGLLTLIPFIWVPGVGLYGCVLLAWLFRWRDARGIVVIMAGWMLASLLVAGATVGVVSFLHT